MVVQEYDSKFYNTTGKISLAGILGLIFITLKLCKVIDWSWLWVLCPFWIPLCIWALILLFCLVLNTKRRIQTRARNRRFEKRRMQQ